MWGKDHPEERRLTVPKKGKSLLKQKPLAHLTPLKCLPRSQASPHSRFLHWCQWRGNTSYSRPCSTGYPVSLVSANLTWGPFPTSTTLAEELGVFESIFFFFFLLCLETYGKSIMASLLELKWLHLFRLHSSSRFISKQGGGIYLNIKSFAELIKF